MEFKPTYLYIKQHSITGKLYFGKTVRKDIVKYEGSGTHWKSHYKVHGKEHIETLWYCLFHDVESIKEFALGCSELWDIVKSDIWLNIKPEDGLMGNITGSKYSDESKARMSAAHKGMSLSKESRDKVSFFNKGKIVSIETRVKISTAHKGKIRTDRHSKNISIACTRKLRSTEAKVKMSYPKQKVTCPHCGKIGGNNIMHRHHFNNCKLNINHDDTK